VNQSTRDGKGIDPGWSEPLSFMPSKVKTGISDSEPVQIFEYTVTKEREQR
jgi:hypothetical protein